MYVGKYCEIYDQSMKTVENVCRQVLRYIRSVDEDWKVYVGKYCEIYDQSMKTVESVCRQVL